ncbi:MAG: 5-formyltetrahydrofolate cyclo-ligase [Thermosynechococcaceae cyanobacterium MS004]|nr:5-formyltetrahydrofolate cyclo-ligase [Thermosynechococcaceae cyanobacterium MS004]
MTSPDGYLQEKDSSAALGKKALRTQLLQRRRSLSFLDWQTKSTLICEHLAASRAFQEARVVLAYLSTHQELDLSSLWQASSPQRWGFPRCVRQDLVWHQCVPSSPEHFQLGAYGILEPITSLPVLHPEEVDLILVPAVACDRQGFRLGYGGGFYDRLLSLPAWAKKPTVGIVFEFAYLDRLPSDPWDCPLQSVCTETGWKT